MSPNQNKQQHFRYGQLFGKTKESNTQRNTLDSPSNSQTFCVNKKPSHQRDWLEQLQLMPLVIIMTTPVIITPYKSMRQSFEISRAYSTPAMNVRPANVFELNQICDTFNNLHHIYFPQVAGGKIGALLGVNTFAYTHPIEVMPGNINQPFGVKTKLGWTLAGSMKLLSILPNLHLDILQQQPNHLFIMSQDSRRKNHI